MMIDEKYFKRVTMSLTDIQICLKYLDKIIECNDPIVHRALEEAIVISYVRPFSGYKKWHVITDLKQEFIKQFDKDEKSVHTRVCKLRDSIIAHSDSKSYGVSYSIIELFEDSKVVMPTMRRVPIILDDADIQVLKSCCLKIETYLFAEQTRITNLLPVGNYQ